MSNCELTHLFKEIIKVFSLKGELVSAECVGQMLLTTPSTCVLKYSGR